MHLVGLTIEVYDMSQHMCITMFQNNDKHCEHFVHHFRSFVPDK